jgi:hypothetical protein
VNKKKLLLLFAVFPTLCACGQSSGPGSAGQEGDTSRVAADSAAEAATLQRSPSPEGAAVSFVTPRDGAVVSSPFRVEFSIAGMQVVPAGTEAPGSGHHHVLVDTDLPDLDLPIPADDHHIHFGDGSSTTELSLPPGEHTLRLLFADHLHIPHDEPVYSEPIMITVE